MNAQMQAYYNKNGHLPIYPHPFFPPMGMPMAAAGFMHPMHMQMKNDKSSQQHKLFTMPMTPNAGNVFDTKGQF